MNKWSELYCCIVLYLLCCMYCIYLFCLCVVVMCCVGGPGHWRYCRWKPWLHKHHSYTVLLELLRQLGRQEAPMCIRMLLQKCLDIYKYTFVVLCSTAPCSCELSYACGNGLVWSGWLHSNFRLDWGVWMSLEMSWLLWSSLLLICLACNHHRNSSSMMRNSWQHEQSGQYRQQQ